MHSTWIALAQALLGLAAFALFVLPAGFLTAFLVDVHGFRQTSWPEQVLWSVAFGLPCATLSTALLAGRVSPATVSGLFLCVLIAAAWLLLRARRARAQSFATAPHRLAPTPVPRSALLLASIFAIYPLLALVDVETGPRLFISTVMSDWAVRVPILNAMIKGILPPTNPFSALSGSAPRLHYYYYWYVLCAQVARFAHITGRAALTASCAWAGFALFSVLMLALKYLLGIGRRLRAHGVASTGLLFVMGLDILVLTLRILIHREHPDFEIEWWREDRTPSFFSTVLYAPHHIAGMAFALTGFLLLVSLLRQRTQPVRGVLIAALSGVCFAATAGTSTYVAFLFTIVCCLWAVDLVRSREWRLLAVLAGCGLVALALSYGFLHELVTTSSGNQVGSGTRGAAHFAVVRFRNQHFADLLLHRRHLRRPGPFLKQGAHLAVALLLDIFELGFFLFVLIRQLRRDIFNRRKLTPAERATWALFLGVALPALFLSSAVVAVANDLGMHAGILVRFILLLWATPWVYELWRSRGSLPRASSPRKLLLGGAALALLLGVSAQMLQLVFERFYLPMIETGVLRKRTDILTSDRLSYRLYNIRAAYRALDPILPPDAIVQFDPSGRMQLAMSLYSNRQIAAADDGCGTGFGGDLAPCKPIYLRLRTFFGLGPKPLVESILPLEDRGTVEEPVGRSSTVSYDVDFQGVCRDLHLNAILVDSKDPEWDMPGSWVWTETPVFKSETARAYLCLRSAAQGQVSEQGQVQRTAQP